MTSIVTIEPGQENSAISLGDDCLTINNIETNDNFNLTVKVIFDVNKILSRKAFKLKVEVCEGERDVIDPEILKLLNSQDILERKRGRLLLYSGNQGKQPITILKQLIDITSFIDNSKTKGKTNNLNNSIKFISEDLVDSKQVIKIPSTLSQKQGSINFLNKDTDLASHIDQTLLDHNSAQLTIVKNLFGTGINQVTKDDSIINTLKDNLFKDTTSKKYLPFISSSNSSLIEIKKTFTVNLSSIVENYILYIDLIDKNGLVIQKLNKSISLGKQVEFAKRIDKKPEFRLVKSSRPNVDYLNLYFKNPKTKLIKVISNTLNTNLNLDNQDQNFNVPIVGRNINVKSFYIDENSNLISDFSSNTFFDKRAKTIGGVVNAHQEKNSIVLNAYNLDTSAISGIFYVKNLTLKTPSVNLGSQIQITNVNSCSTVHNSFIPGHIYEYYFISYMSDGTKKKSKSIIFETYPIKEIGISVNLSEISVTQNNVAFNMEAQVLEKNTDIILQLLKDRGIDNFYSSNLSDQITQIKKFIAFSVFRFNKNTGDKEFIGTQISNTFSDIDACVKKSIAPYNQGFSYQYEVYPSLIDPNTMLDSQTAKHKNLNSLITYNQQKFRHTLAIKNSMLITENGLKTKFASSILDHNILGFSTTFDTSSDSFEDITNLQIELLKNLSPQKVRISWEVENENSTKLIDFFLIGRNINGKQEIIGKSISGNNSFIDTLSEKGNIEYYVMPIYTDNSIGNSKSINYFIEV